VRPVRSERPAAPVRERGLPAATIDLDRAATTPVAEDVLAAMLPYFSERAGNPASVHAAGRSARRALEEARERVAAAVRATPRQVVFTSGATEALHLAVHGSLGPRAGAHAVTSRTEHAAVVEALRACEGRGHEVTWLRPDRDGVVARAAVEAALGPATALVALMRTNNETGVQHDLGPLRAALRARGVRVLVDAVQAFGYEPVDLETLGADMIALSSHKVGGPKGCGALVLGQDVVLEAQQRGGGQERGLRGGTVDVPAVVGFALAAERAADWQARAARVAALRDRFEAALLRLPGVHVNAARAPRGPKHANVRFDDVDGEVLLINLDTLGVLASAGSACAAGSIEPSHVLLAMGQAPAEARASIRFSFGDHLDEGVVDEAAHRVAAAVQRSRGVDATA
jgi:cysteine desulfurase